MCVSGYWTHLMWHDYIAKRNGIWSSIPYTNQTIRLSGSIRGKRDQIPKGRTSNGNKAQNTNWGDDGGSSKNQRFVPGTTYRRLDLYLCLLPCVVVIYRKPEHEKNSRRNTEKDEYFIWAIPKICCLYNVSTYRLRANSYMLHVLPISPYFMDHQHARQIDLSLSVHASENVFDGI